MRLVTTLGVAAFFTVLVAPVADATVDLEVSLKTSANGTISPSGETERFSFDGNEGTLVTFTVVGKTLDLSVALTDPGDNTADLASFSGYVDAGTKISVKSFPLTSTGTWELAVSGVGTGDYKLKLKGKPAKKYTETLTVDAEDSDTVSISAPAGSTVILKAKAGKGSDAEPRFGTVDGQDLSALGKFSTKAHKVSFVTTDGGDIDVPVDNLATSAGDILVKISVKAPKPEANKLDVRAESLGSPEDGGTAVSRQVQAAAGGTVEVSDGESSIDGASVDIPGGALAANTTVTVNSAGAVNPPNTSTQQQAGPAVKFGPAGTTFSSPVTLTIPYDPDILPFGADPGTDLQVVRVAADGTQSTLSPTAVDQVDNEITVETSSFSTFMAFIPKGPPNLDGREYWAMFLEVEFESNQNDDSRTRTVWGGIGSTELGDRGVADDGTSSFSEIELSWTHNENDAGSVTETSSTDSETVTWDYLSGNTSVRVDFENGDSVDYAISSEGAALVAGYESSDEPLSFVELLIEKPSTTPTLASLAGKYWYGTLGFAAFGGGGGPLGLELWREFGTLTLNANGTWSVQAQERYCEFNPVSTTTTCEAESFKGGAGYTWVVSGQEAGDFAGTLLLTEVDEEDGDEVPFRILPGAGGNILMGAPFSDEEGYAVIAVRQSSGMSASDFAGQFAMRALQEELTTYTGTQNTLGDVVVSNLQGTVTFDDVDGLSSSITEREVSRDAQTQSGVSIDVNSGLTPGGPVSYGAKGSFEWDPDDGGGDFIGAMTSDGEFGFMIEDPGNGEDTFNVFLLLKRPAVQEF